jgi:hypothetical protein
MEAVEGGWLMSLQAALARVPDPRQRSGRRHPLSAMLLQATVAILGGARSLNAIAQFGRDRGEAFGRAVGYPRPDRLPCVATFHYLFKALDAEAFERELARWLAGRADAGGSAVAIDGKTLRGSADGDLPGVHLLAAYAPEARTAVAQMRVEASTNEHQAALQMLERLELDGQVVTGDAAFCQRDLSGQVVKKGATTSGRSRPTSPSCTRRSARRSPPSTTRRARTANDG